MLTAAVGKRKPPLDDLTTVARARDQRVAVEIRTRKEVASLKLRGDRSYTDFENVSNVAGAFTTLTTSLNSVDADINAIGASIRSMSSGMATLQSIMQEQSDLAWLLVSRTSTRENFKTLEDAVELAIDCASAIRLFPAPPNLGGLTRAVLRTSANKLLTITPEGRASLNTTLNVPNVDGIQSSLPITCELANATGTLELSEMKLSAFVTALCNEILLARYISDPQ